MKNARLFLTLSLSSLLLFGCDANSSSSSTTPASSSETTSSSAAASSTSMSADVHASTFRIRGTALTETDDGYTLTSPYVSIAITKGTATGSFENTTSYLAMPSGSQLSVNVLTDGYYLINEYTDPMDKHYQSYIGFYSAEDASASLTISGATGTVSGSNVNLAYTSSASTLSPSPSTLMSRSLPCH